MARYAIIHSVDSDHESGDWYLSFQYGRYEYDDGSSERGYRFIYHRPDGSLQPARGQARIPSGTVMMSLITKALEEGWFVNCETE